MTSEWGKTAPGMTDMTGIEAHLAAMLTEAEDEVAHMESLDTEQRAEIYTILQALKADSQLHRQLVGQWANDITGETHDV